MGADLYIRSIYQPHFNEHEPEFKKWVSIRDKAASVEEHEKAQEKVNEAYEEMYSVGYFRDSYNSTSLFQQLGISWWQDVSKMIDGDGGYLSPSNAKKLLERIRAIQLKPVTRAWLEENRCKIADEGENSVAGWNVYFWEKKIRFEKFLEKAIELDESIECSI